MKLIICTLLYCKNEIKYGLIGYSLCGMSYCGSLREIQRSRIKMGNRLSYVRRVSFMPCYETATVNWPESVPEETVHGFIAYPY